MLEAAGSGRFVFAEFRGSRGLVNKVEILVLELEFDGQGRDHVELFLRSRFGFRVEGMLESKQGSGCRA